MSRSGVSIGATIGPPIGGALYDAMGWHAPFIFCIICCAVDFVGRMLVVEQRDARLWLEEVDAKSEEKKTTESNVEKAQESSTAKEEEEPVKPKKELSPLAVIAKLGKIPRGLAAISAIGAYSLIIGLQEPT